MSDFPVFVPPFVRPSDRADGPVFAARDCEYVADEALYVEDNDLEATVETPAPREGLPPSFRTRHEPHYVEALLSPAALGARGPARGPAVALPGVASALPVIAEALESIRAALGDLPMRGRPLRERVALELARAEAVRAGWLAGAAAVLQAAPVIALDEVDLASVLRSVADALGPEHRLTGTSPSIYVPEGRFPVRGDERLLTLAVGAALAAMRTLVEDRADPSRLVVRLAPRQDGTVRTVDVSQAVPISLMVANSISLRAGIMKVNKTAALSSILFFILFFIFHSTVVFPIFYQICSFPHGQDRTRPARLLPNNPLSFLIFLFTP